MADRLLVDVDADARTRVSVWVDGELPEEVGESFALSWPVADGDLDELRWYLEDYLRVPFGVYEDRGAAVADSLREWGTNMFSALFGAGPARDAYVRFRSRAAWPGGAEIVVRSASPAWLGLPWELLYDPQRPAPVALDGVSISRSVPAGGQGAAFRAEGDRLRVLIVISRPSGTQDVGYQMIARPLMRGLEGVRGQVDVDVLRPPTLDALAETLRAARDAGRPYQIVHFDGHGMLDGRRAAPPAGYGTSGQGMLVFEKPGGGADRVPAARVAQVLDDARVPVVVLNACQSGAIGKELEAAVATRLLAGGASVVVAMAYSVYAVAAAEFMTVFYERLFAGDTVGEAVRAGRAQMAQHPERPSPKGDLPLDDWLVPVHYQRREVRFPRLRTASRAEVSLTGALQRLREPDVSSGPLAATGAFVGRDDLFYTLEAAARGQQVVVLHGAAGTGKTELARAFGRWWRDTGGAERPEWVIWHSFEPGVASSGLDGMIAAVGQQAFGADFAVHDAETRRRLVCDLLREHRLLVILDNFESVRSMPEHSAATDEADCAELKDFLAQAAAGRGMLLVTSRTPEAWLGGVRQIHVGGLRHHEAIEYAGLLLDPFPAAAARRGDRAFGELLEWLDGHPLSMRLIMPRLETMDAATILAGLCGAAPLPEAGDGGRTMSLSASIAYSMNHLDAADQRLLVAVSVFQGAVNARILGAFSARDQVPRRFAGTDTASWAEVLERASRVGLLTTLATGMYAIHPALPAYLAEQWKAGDPEAAAAERAAAERALLDACASYGLWLTQQIDEGDAALAYRLMGWQRRTLGHMLADALNGGLWGQAFAIAVPLNEYWNRGGMAVEADAWADRAQLALEGPDGTLPPPDGLAGALWRFFLGAKANRLNLTGQHDAAAAIYARINDMVAAQPGSPGQQETLAIGYHQQGVAALKRGDLDAAEGWHRKSLEVWERDGDRIRVAGNYHQLARIEQERGHLEKAEEWHKKVLAIHEEIGSKQDIAASHHELGFVAQELERWDEAEEHYLRALAIKEHLNDRPAMTTTYLQLGTLAHKRAILTQNGGILTDAQRWYHKALAIQEELDDRPGKAKTYYQLGVLAQTVRKLDEAEQWYSKAVPIFQELGDRTSMVIYYANRGVMAHQRNQPVQALEWLVRSVAVFDEFPHPATKQSLPFLAELVKRLGVQALEECWQRVTGNRLPPSVREFASTVRPAP